MGNAPSDDSGSPVEGQLSRRLFDNLFVFVGLLDPSGVVLETNSAPLTIAGLRSDDVVGRAFWDCYWWTLGADVERQVRDDVARVAAGDVVRRDVLVRIVDDGRMWIDFQLAPVRDDDGTVTHLIASGFEIGDRKAAEAALATSEARFRSIFSSVDEGFCLCEMITDAAGVPTDYRFIEVNPLFEQMTGLTDPVGRTALELVPDLERNWIDTYGRVAFGDAPLRFQQGSDAMGRWFDVFCVPVEPRGHFALVFKDISAARVADASLQNAARRDRYRAELMDALRELVDPIEVQIAGANLLSRTLGIDAVHYADVDVEMGTGQVAVDASGSSASIIGTHRLDDYGSIVSTAVREGRVLVVDDVATDARLDDAERAATAALQIASYVVVPVVAGGTAVGLLAVHHTKPRQWSRLEIELVEKTAERTHAALMFARAHVELRDSEERFRSMADGLPLPVWLVDPAGDLAWANVAFFGHFGPDPDTIARDGWHILAHPDHAGFLTEFAAAMAERRPFHGEVLALHRSGTWRWFESWGQPHFGPDGRYLGHIGTNADITDRKATEEAERRTRRRADLITAMITSLEAESPVPRAQRLLDVLVPAFADYATVEAPDLADPVVAVRHHDPTVEPTLLALRTDHRLRPDDEQSISRAAGGRHQFLPALTSSIIAEFDVGTVGGRLLQELGPRSHMAVPLDLGGNVRGALMVGISDPARDTYGEGDLDFLSELASHASVIIASAVLQEREHGISLRLQEALLPRELAATDQVSLAARYVAASDVLEVGGDWYDSIALDDGRILLVVGDVVGHGLDAAAMMGRLRAGLAALTGQESDPGRLLAMLDHYARHTGDADYTTVCCAVIDPANCTLTHASAGHPPILLVQPDGTSRWLEDGRSTPLCVGAPAERGCATTALVDGAQVVLYTDGLVERRGEHLDLGLERLRRVAVDARHLSPLEMCDRLIAMSAETPTDDDTVVLCVRFHAVTA